MPAWAGVGLVLVALGGVLASLQTYQRRCAPPPERVRKLLHVLMGLVTLSFPWLFDAAAPVLVLAGLAVVGLIGLRVFTTLRAGIGAVVHAVDRESLGEIYFPVAVALLFVLAKGDPILFGVPILILTLADALAALIGMRYGQVRYTTGEGEKSAEGSIAFFLVAFLSVHVPLLLFTETGRAETLLIAAILGVLLALFEAIAWRGLDNLLVPLGAFVLLKVYLTFDVASLGARLVVAAALVAFTLAWRRRTTLNDGGALAAALVGYVCWSVGSWPWLLPPLVVLLSYTLYAVRAPADLARAHDPRVVLSVSAAGLLWLFLAKALAWGELHFVFTLSFAAQLAMAGLADLSEAWPAMRPRRAILLCGVTAWLFLIVPWVAYAGLDPGHAVPGTLALPIVVAAASALWWLEPTIRGAKGDGWRWARQALIGFAASLLGLFSLQVTA